MTKKIIHFILGIALISILSIEIARSWTEWPKVHLVYTTTQEDLVNVASPYDVLGKFNTFAYFTTLANIIAVIAIAITWVLRIKTRTPIRVIVLTYMTITFGVFWTSIAPFLPWGQSIWFDFIYSWEHGVVFVATLYWVFTDRNDKKLKNQYAISLVFPILYVVFNLVLFSIDHDAVVYPFLNFSNWFALDLSKEWSFALTMITIATIAGLVVGAVWTFNKIVKKVA